LAPDPIPARRPRAKAARYLLLSSAAGALALGIAFLFRSAAAPELPVRPEADPAARAQAAAPAVPQPAAPSQPAPARQPAQPEAAPAQPPAQAEPAPAQQPARQPARQAAAEQEYRVQWGDTLWRITENYYGDRSLYLQLAERNLLVDPDRIISGQSLVLPPELEPGSRRQED
jgi:nucleoid-associated protein YgaU